MPKEKTMETTDITTAILRSIRDDIAKLDAKFDAKIDGLDAKFDAKIDGLDAKLSAKIDGLDAKIDREIRLVREDMRHLVTRDEFHGTMRLFDERLDRVYACVVDLDARTAANHRELQSEIRRIHGVMDGHGVLAERIERCELDIVDLKHRVL
jgi:hypothetical protein